MCVCIYKYYICVYMYLKFSFLFHSLESLHFVPLLYYSFLIFLLLLSLLSLFLKSYIEQARYEIPYFSALVTQSKFWD